MIGPRGGFTAHDRYLGWRGLCACGWVGPWRGSSLTMVEEDVMEHWGDCPDRCRDQGKRGSNRTPVRPENGTLGASKTNGPERRYERSLGTSPTDEGSAMEDVTAAVNDDAIGGER